MLRNVLICGLVALLLPFIWRWARRQERLICESGRPLDAPELEDAHAVGVAFPERIRVCVVQCIPMPGPTWIQHCAAHFGFPAEDSCGMSLRYGIYLQTDYSQNRHVLVHECVHTAQYERLGGFRIFLKKYLLECLLESYSASALELEAVEISERHCSKPR